MKALEELVSRIDGKWPLTVEHSTGDSRWSLLTTSVTPLPPEDIHNHFKRYEVEYLQFAFRWMNNLLMRELPLRCTIRLWDTYQVEKTVPCQM